MDESSALERLLRRDRAVTIVALAVLCGLAWLYVLRGAGLGMSASGMARLALFPRREMAGGMAGMAMPVAGWNVAGWALMIAMWWTMMIAMMVPSAAPAILLYGRVHRHAAARGDDRRSLAPTGAFAASYLLVWLAFSIVAAGLHRGLEHGGAISATMMDSRSRWLSAAILIAAGLYQLTPLKSACLTRCRAPAAFLSRYWRPGVTGALRLGALHGAYCVGCCWALMALLFVGGVMNLLWIVLLAGLVLVEKLTAKGLWIGRIAGGLFIAWGLATLVPPGSG